MKPYLLKYNIYSKETVIIMDAMNEFRSLEELSEITSLKHDNLRNRIYAMEENGFKIERKRNPENIRKYLYRIISVPEGYTARKALSIAKNFTDISPAGDVPWYLITSERKNWYRKNDRSRY